MLTTLPFSWAGVTNEIIGIMLAVLYFTGPAIGIGGVMIKLWKQKGTMVFHLAGIVLWFVFLTLYSINIHLYYREGC